MALEIERKFLPRGDQWRNLIEKSSTIVQGYLVTGGMVSVRVRIESDGQHEHCTLNIKQAVIGAKRLEYEYQVPLAEGREMLESLCAGGLIRKTRHLVRSGGRKWEIDEFAGANQGLLVAEIELDDDAQTFEKPDWIGIDVTGFGRYYNISLAQHPFSTWSAEEKL